MLKIVHKMNFKKFKRIALNLLLQTYFDAKIKYINVFLGTFKQVSDDSEGLSEMVEAGNSRGSASRHTVLKKMEKMPIQE